MVVEVYNHGILFWGSGMMRIWRTLIFLLALFCCAEVLAAPKGTMLYIPMDNRPVCLDYALQTMRAAGWDVRVPPREYIAGAERGGDPEQLLSWLEANAAESIVIVASSDALIYGGLVDSRTHELPLAVLQQRAQRLLDVKKNYGGQTMYIFTTIMRSPRMSAAPVEPAYYAQWGAKIFRLGALEDKAELKEISRKERRELTALREEIPSEILQDMYTRRANNIKTTELLLHGVESGDFDYLLIGRDDTASYSQAHREARDMDILVNELPKERIRFFAGADQLGLLLLSRASTRLQYELPFVHTFYAPGAGGATVPAYEDNTLAQSAKQHIYAAGAIPVPTAANADLLLAVNSPDDGKTLEASSAVNDYTITPALHNFLTKVKLYADSGRPLAIADVKYGNGADNALVAQLFADKIAYVPVAYSGWNTAGNSLGYALAQGLMYKMYGEREKNALLTTRYLDDWAYQANVRMKIYQDLIWPNHWPNSGLDEIALNAAQDEITREIYALTRPIMGEEAEKYTFTLPWQRMFEVYVAEK